jgi:hypothetical protein
MEDRNVDIVSLIIQLVAGAAGGNIVGALAKNLSLGTAGNTIAGAVGGLGGAQILDMILGGDGAVADAAAAVASSGLDIGSIIQQIAGGGVGGGILMLIVGLIKSMTSK